MKNSKLTFSGFASNEPLSRSQMRKITGGLFGSDQECIAVCYYTLDTLFSGEFSCPPGQTVSDCYFMACAGRPDIIACRCEKKDGEWYCED